jgi:hypothetical protein
MSIAIGLVLSRKPLLLAREEQNLETLKHWLSLREYFAVVSRDKSLRLKVT